MANYSLKELVAKFDSLLVDLPKEILLETEIAGKDMLAETEDRIVHGRGDASGAAFKPYTPAYLRFKTGGQKLTQARIEKNRSKGIPSTARGKHAGFVNFTLTGQMLASTDSGLVNILPTEKTVSPSGRARVVFDGRDKETRDKLEGNDNARPGFMSPSKAEVDKASGFAGKRLEKKIAARFA